MKTLLTFALATLMFASCNQPKGQNAETESSNDAVTELMMSHTGTTFAVSWTFFWTSTLEVVCFTYC